MNETEQRDNTHGEPEKKARFGPDSPDFTPSGNSSDPRGPDNIAAGKASDPRGEDSVSDREAAGGISSRGAVGGAESGLANQLGKGFTGGGAATGGGAFGALRPLLKFLTRNKKKTAAGGVVSAVVGIMVFLGGIASGPFEFIHFAQLLQQFHFQSNEDFGDERGARSLLYALTGQAQKSRLGSVGNFAADKWEAKLLKETGLRPVYKARSRVLAGFEIVNDKYVNSLLGADKKTSAGLERAMGKGAEVTTAGSIRGQDIVRGNGEVLSGDTHLVNLDSVKSYRERGKFVKTVGKLTGTNKVVSVLASRLLIKRAGVDFHPFRNLAHKAVDKLVDWRYERRKEAAKKDKEGVKSGRVGARNTEDTDDDKEPDSPSEPDKVAAEGSEEVIDEAAKELAKNNIKILVKRIGAGTVAVGVLCAAKGFGDAVPDYKYTNNVLPMMRMGFRVISMGNQAMGGDDISLDELGAFKDALYDPETKSSWHQGATVQGELGQKQTGPKTPPEASLQNVNDKPLFFDLLDKIPFLGTACDISGIAGSIPLVGDVLDLGSDAVLAGLNVAAGAAGTSVEKIMEGALSLVSGNSVNVLASGADYGNLANTGAFLAANDNAATMGGSPLTNSQRAELRFYEQENLRNENQTKSFAERYLDPYSASSLVGKFIDNAPRSVNDVASMLASPLNLFSGGLFNNLVFGTNIASAAGNVDYGVPKFGFSLADQEDPEFENPYDNAEKVEPKLDELNEKYGKPCFGMSITTTGDGIKIETEEMGSDDLNVFKVLDNKKCMQNSGALSSETESSDSFWSKLAFWQPEKTMAAESGGSVDPWFTRYRFYLADSISAVSNACYQSNGSDDGSKYCSMLGLGGSSGGGPSPAADAAGDTFDESQLYKSSVGVGCAAGTKDLGVQDGYHDHKKIKIRVCAVQSVTETGDTSDVPRANGKLVVNSLVSGAVVKMYADAKSDGVSPLTASEGFRSMARQTELANCAPGCTGGRPVADPGTSNHQMGIAIDADGAMQAWMVNNSKKYGFTWYGPGDDVHFSPDGS